jgi:hypothetical protein
MKNRKQKHRYNYKITVKFKPRHKFKPIRFDVHDVNRFWKDDMFYFLLGTYISSDTLLKERDYKASYQKLIDLLEGLKSDECIVPIDERQKNIERVSECIDLVKNEYKDRFLKELVYD